MDLAELLDGQRGFVAVVDVDQELARLADVVVVEQGRIEGFLDGKRHTLGAFGIAGVDDGHAAVAQDGVDVGEVEVHFSGDIHQVGDTACGITEGVVGLGEGSGDGEVLVDLDEALVIDHQ